MAYPPSKDDDEDEDDGPGMIATAAFFGIILFLLMKANIVSDLVGYGLIA
jgi:hypothetical protein